MKTGMMEKGLSASIFLSMIIISQGSQRAQQEAKKF